MEKYSSTAALKLAIFAVLLLTISGPSMGARNPGVSSGSEDEGVVSSSSSSADVGMREAIKELAKEKVELLKAYERVFAEAIKKRMVGQESLVLEQKLKCYGPGYPCNSWSECCSQECYMGTCF